MSKRQPTTQVIHSNDYKWLEKIKHEAEEYRGLRTNLRKDKLVIQLIDSDKYWRKRRNKKKKPDYEDMYKDLY